VFGNTWLTEQEALEQIIKGPGNLKAEAGDGRIYGAKELRKRMAKLKKGTDGSP
jgi:hypothetical protein